VWGKVVWVGGGVGGVSVVECCGWVEGVTVLDR